MKPALFLALFLAAVRPAGLGAATNTPLAQPDYQQFTLPAATAMREVSRSNLAPAYPYLAEHFVAKYELANRGGIGVEVGGGPGVLTVELSRRSPLFYWLNTDINTFHAEAFFQRALTNGCAGRVGWVFADVHRLPFRDEYADLVVSRGSLQFWADPKAAFAEIYRILKPGGHAVIGRGFAPNMPLAVAKSVRANQGQGMPKYDPAETAEQMRRLMQDLKIAEFQVVRPHTNQTEVSYGVWLYFGKPARPSAIP